MKSEETRGIILIKKLVLANIIIMAILRLVTYYREAFPIKAFPIYPASISGGRSSCIVEIIVQQQDFMRYLLEAAYVIMLGVIVLE